MNTIHLVGGDNEQAQSAEAREAMQRRFNPPANQLPGAIPFDPFAINNGELAVALVSAQAYLDGIRLYFAIRRRALGDADDGVRGELGGIHENGAQLLVGVAYPDGRVATNLGQSRFPRPSTAVSQPTLAPGSGGGDDLSYDLSYWLTPMPPPGDLTVIMAWPSRDLVESRFVIPAASIARGLENVVELWPWSPPAEYHPKPPPVPVLPPGSWFSEHVE
jgi:hypothetical protein